MPEYIEVVGEESTNCTVCKKEATIRAFVLRDTHPYKLFSVLDCQECGHSESSQCDFEELDYAVRITCDFKPSSALESQPGEFVNENLCRMAFINNDATVTIYVDDKVLVEFSNDFASVYCLQNLLMRGAEIVSCARDEAANDDTIERTKKQLANILNGAAFKLKIVDESGFSRVCPPGREYTEIQELDVAQLDEPDVKYEKLPKNSSAAEL
ncbi:hypothetical protein PAPHI01_1050 [Pancytospora philotis]|nr:hypothetical protein PAPHI01_1050 [Pancytospora philotis]